MSRSRACRLRRNRDDGSVQAPSRIRPTPDQSWLLDTASFYRRLDFFSEAVELKVEVKRSPTIERENGQIVVEVQVES